MWLGHVDVEFAHSAGVVRVGPPTSQLGYDCCNREALSARCTNWLVKLALCDFQLLAGLVYGRTPAELQERLDGRSENELRASGLVVGTSEELQAQIAVYASVGVQRLMLQWLYQDDLDGLEALAEVLK